MNIEQATTHPIVTYAKENLWGSAKIGIPEQFEAGFNALSLTDQQLVRAFYTGATTACGVAISLAENPQYGPAYQEARYTSVNFWYVFLKENLPSHLSRPFGSPVELKIGKGVSKFDPDWLDKSHRQCLQGPATYEGFVLPRLVIDVINHATKTNSDPGKEFVNLFDKLSQSPTILQAVVVAAKHQLGSGVPAETVKTRVFNESIHTELHPDYWSPIYRRLNIYLPEIKMEMF